MSTDVRMLPVMPLTEETVGDIVTRLKGLLDGKTFDVAIYRHSDARLPMDFGTGRPLKGVDAGLPLELWTGRRLKYCTVSKRDEEFATLQVMPTEGHGWGFGVFKANIDFDFRKGKVIVTSKFRNWLLRNFIRECWLFQVQQ